MIATILVFGAIGAWIGGSAYLFGRLDCADDMDNDPQREFNGVLAILWPLAPVLLPAWHGIRWINSRGHKAKAAKRIPAAKARGELPPHESDREG